MAKEPLLDKAQRFAGEALDAGIGAVQEGWGKYGQPAVHRVEDTLAEGRKRAVNEAGKVAIGTFDWLGDRADDVRRITRRPREVVKTSVPAFVMGLVLIDKPIPAVILAAAQQVTHVGGGIAKSIRTRNGWHAFFAVGEAVTTFGTLAAFSQTPEVAALTGATLSEITTMKEHGDDAKEFHLVPATPRPKRSARRR